MYVLVFGVFNFFLRLKGLFICVNSFIIFIFLSLFLINVFKIILVKLGVFINMICMLLIFNFYFL